MNSAYKKIEELLEGIDINISIEGEEFKDFDQLREHIQINGGFDVEIIYYARAIDYLKENDNSLKESLELADEMGYQVNSLSSEILASLLASQNTRNDFEELRSEVEKLIEEK